MSLFWNRSFEFHANNKNERISYELIRVIDLGSELKGSTSSTSHSPDGHHTGQYRGHLGEKKSMMMCVSSLYKYKTNGNLKCNNSSQKTGLGIYERIGDDRKRIKTKKN